MNDLLETLLGVRPALFREGELVLAASSTQILLVSLAGLAAAAVLWWSSRRIAGGLRWALLALRLAALAIVLFCLLRPALALSAVVPQQSFVAVLADNSASMTVADLDERPRAEWTVDALSAGSGGLLDQLLERFKVRLFGFDRGVRRLSGVEELAFDGRWSRVAGALEQTAEEMSAVPLSGIVLLTDGALDAGPELTDALLELRARGVPVYPVVLGQKRLPRDVEVQRIDAPASVLRGSSVEIEVTIDHSGLRGRSVQLDIEDEGRIVATEQVELQADGEPVVVRSVFTAEEAGPRHFRARLQAMEGELVVANNERTSLIEVLDRREKILYFEGEPRHEVSFLRRAIAKDEGLQLVSLVRLADNRFTRLEVDSGDELAGGFPTTREELFRYRGLVLGSIEASFFTYEQMRMILDFVSQRGGGLLVLGGGRAFGEGGYAGTPVDEVLPVVLPSGTDEAPFFASLKVEPTAHGRAHPALRLADDEERSSALWLELPELSTRNRLSQLKPGATGLLTGAESDDQVMMAYQRYGRGRSIALAAQDSWKWQMKMPLEDQSHETFWRQVLRWLVSYVPDQVEIRLPQSRVEIGDEMTLSAMIHDAQFLEVNSARVEATIEKPSGDIETVALDWSVQQDGLFEVPVAVAESGLHKITIEASTADEELGEATAWIEGASLNEEMFRAHRRGSVLERVASETGGRVVEPGEVTSLVEDLTYSREGVTVRELREFWDMPLALVMLALLVGSEWGLRRWRGLA